MDLSFLPSASEYNEQRTGGRFTIRSANSPSYSLTRRPGVRQSLSFLEEKKERPKEVAERCVTHAGSNGANKEEDTVAGYQASNGSHSSVKGQYELSQNGTTDKINTKSDTDRRENHGKTERKKYSRSMSLDLRREARSPDSSTRADRSTLLAKAKKQAGDPEDKCIEAESERSKVMSSVQAYSSAATSSVVEDRSPVNHMSHALDRTTRGHTLPSRFRSQSGQGSKFKETSSASKGESILERIGKLYESAGFGKEEDYCKIRDLSNSVTTTDLPQQKPYKPREGGTFPRRFSAEEGSSLCPWIPQKDRSSDSSHSAATSRRLSGGQWQEQIQGRSSVDVGVSWGKGTKDIGTRSLDRARSRNTAARIQNSQIPRERKPSESMNGQANFREEICESKGTNEAKEKTELKSSNNDEDVFESNSQKVTGKTAERNWFPKTLPPSSAASVRNKINQFEALSQRAQGSVPRRALSVPAQFSVAHNERKMSGSLRAKGGLRDRWEGMREGEDTGDTSPKKVAKAETKLGHERSLSVDEGGLRLCRNDKIGKDLGENEGTVLDSSNKRSEDVGKYSKLKSTLEIPLNRGTQRRSGNFHIDETDSSKVLGPEEANRRDMTSNDTPPLLLSSSDSAVVQKTTPSQVTSPVKDDGDKTPTNTPNNSPFLSPTTQPENAIPSALEKDSPPLPRPLATSSYNNLHNLNSPDVSNIFSKAKKGIKDLNAWIAGLNSDVSVWTDEEGDYEDDDESTQKDEDSNYDSDSGESSVTITSNMSQSDRRSFCVSLSDLCNFAGIEDESENDSDEWTSTGRRSVSLSSDVSALSCVSVMPSEELDRLLEDVKSLGDNNLQDYNDVQVVVLHKDMGVGMGFSLAGGLDQNKPVTVHKVFHSGVAAQEGSIREGDQVLSINGTALCGCNHWEALRVLRRAKSREMAVVVLRRGDVCGVSKYSGVQGNKQGPTQVQVIQTGQRVSVCLEKNSRDLGFTLEGGVGSSLGNRPLTIQKIFQGGPVDKVSPGDEVLEIGGVSTVGMSRLEAWTLIRKLPPGPVNVVLHHPLKHKET